MPQQRPGPVSELQRVRFFRHTCTFRTNGGDNRSHDHDESSRNLSKQTALAALPFRRRFMHFTEAC